ncbi:MAG: PorP/SprF family type IX secretion system membrane protein [Bacteroidota bacterium]
MNRLSYFALVLAMYWLFGSFCTLQAQVVQVQHMAYVNPYFNNPAFLGESKYKQVYASYKRQWLGIADAPSIATITYEAPLLNNLNVGGFIQNTSEGISNRIAGQMAAAYELQLEAYQYLQFGLSLGIAYDNFDSAALDDPNDPVVLGRAQGALRPDGGLGIAYINRDFTFGFSLPSYLTPSPFSTRDFPDQASFKLWDYRIFSAAFDYDLNSEWTLTSKLFFHSYATFDNQLEGGLLLDYQERFNGGFFYRRDMGATVLFGLVITQAISAGYFYSFSTPSANLPNDSHELFIRFRLGYQVR